MDSPVRFAEISLFIHTVLWWCALSSLKVANSQTLDFDLVANYTPWLGRYRAQVHVLQNSIDYNSTIFPVGSFLLYGGSADRYLRSVVNDVWISHDKTESWTRLGGLATDQIFPIFPYCTFINDPSTDQSYAISNDNYEHSETLPLWTSTSMSNWSAIIPQISGLSPPRSPFSNRSGFSCTVGSNSDIYCMMGVDSTVGTRPPYNDVWLSADQGHTWSARTTRSEITGRFNLQSGIHRKNPHLQGRDIMYVMGGTAPNFTNLADLWASSDSATSWAQLSTPEWLSASSDSTLTVTRDGILLVSVYNHVLENYTSDVWASFDGGYSWNLCLQNASYQARISPSLAIDAGGFLYVIGGLVMPRRSRIFYNDVWRSRLSVYHWSELATACQTIVPVGGVGLRSWPGISSNSSSSTGIAPASSSSRVTAAYQSSSSSTATGFAPASHQFPTWAWIVIILSGLLLCGMGGLCWGLRRSLKWQQFRQRYLSFSSHPPNPDLRASLILEPGSS